MMSTQDIYALIEERRKELGLTQAQVSLCAFNRNDTSPIQNIRRGSSPSVDKLEALANALGLEFYIGMRRQECPSTITEISGEKFSAVARYDARAAAGAGAINFDDPPVDHLAFSRGWLESQDIRASSAVLITVAGDSMAPTLHNGDLVMIDRSRTILRSGRVYVFNDPENGTRLKRLDILQGAGVVIRSDNPDQEAHPPEFRAVSAADKLIQGLIGEVVWSAHTWS